MEDLDKINRDALDAELRATHSTTSHHAATSVVDTGRIEIPREIFGYKGVFYPNNWRFFHKRITLQDVKHYSSVDESNPIMLYNAYTDLVKNTISIIEKNVETGRERYLPYNVLYEHDRIPYILQMHRDTKGTTNALKTSYTCSQCSKQHNVIIQPELLQYNEIDDFIMKYHDLENGGPINIVMKDGNTKLSKPTTIQVSERMRAYLMSFQDGTKQPDNTFMRLFNIMHVNNPSHDTNKKLISFYDNINNTDFYLYKFINDKSPYGMKNILSHECDCRFRNEVKYKLDGITSIFDDADVIDLFA